MRDGAARRISGFWLPEQVILYTGLAGQPLCTRVRQYYTTPLGAKRPHNAPILGGLEERPRHSAVEMPGEGLEPPRSCEQRLLRSRPLPIGLPGQGRIVRFPSTEEPNMCSCYQQERPPPPMPTCWASILAMAASAPNPGTSSGLQSRAMRHIPCCSGGLWRRSGWFSQAEPCGWYRRLTDASWSCARPRTGLNSSLSTALGESTLARSLSKTGSARSHIGTPRA